MISSDRMKQRQDLADVFWIEVEVVGDVFNALAGFGVLEHGIVLNA